MARWTSLRQRRELQMASPICQAPGIQPRDISPISLATLKPGDLLMLPWAETRVKENQSNDHKNDPMVACMPPGVPRVDFTGGGAMLHPFKIVQTPTLVVLLYQTSTNQTFRQVFMDGRAFPEEMQPTWLGYSIGRWEGDTLVVNTDRIQWSRVGRYWGGPSSNGGGKGDRAFHPPRFRASRPRDHHRRSRRVPEPWTARVPASLLADSDLIETFCDNERDLGKMFRTPVTHNREGTQWPPSLIHFLAAARHRLPRIRTRCSLK